VKERKAGVEENNRDKELGGGGLLEGKIRRPKPERQGGARKRRKQGSGPI